MISRTLYNYFVMAGVHEAESSYVYSIYCVSSHEHLARRAPRGKLLLFLLVFFHRGRYPGTRLNNLAWLEWDHIVTIAKCKWEDLELR